MKPIYPSLSVYPFIVFSLIHYFQEAISITPPSFLHLTKSPCMILVCSLPILALQNLHFQQIFTTFGTLSIKTCPYSVACIVIFDIIVTYYSQPYVNQNIQIAIAQAIIPSSWWPHMQSSMAVVWEATLIVQNQLMGDPVHMVRLQKPLSLLKSNICNYNFRSKILT